MRTVARIGAMVATGIVLLASVSGLIAYLAIRHDVDQASLSYSVAGRLQGFARCRLQHGHTWTCVASPEQAPDVGPWIVTVSGHCWRATLDRSSRGASGLRAFRGCIGIWDQLRLRDFDDLRIRLRGYD